jgi:hypothetical protein
MGRSEMVLAEEVETRSGWCDRCLRESIMDVTYYVTPMTGPPYLDRLVWCEECDQVEVEER